MRTTNNGVFSIVSAYFLIKGQPFHQDDPVHQIIFRKYSRDAKNLLTLCSSDSDAAIRKIKEVGNWAKQRGLTWNLSTVVKRFLDDNTTEEKPVDNWKPEAVTAEKGSVIDGLRSVRHALDTH